MKPSRGTQYDPVRVIWLDAYSPGNDVWISPKDLEMEVWGTLPVHETVGLLFGMRDDFLVVIQTRGAAEDYDKVDNALAIPLRSVLLVERLTAAEVIYER